MFKVYPGTEIANLHGPIKLAGELSRKAGTLQTEIRRQVSESSVSGFEVSYSSTETVLDFRLSTVFGSVYAQYDMLRLDKRLVGRYRFFFEGRDEQSNPVCKPVFAFLFSTDGRYMFCEGGTPTQPVGGLSEMDADFVWRLVGNVLLSVYDQLDDLTSTFDIAVHI